MMHPPTPAGGQGASSEVPATRRRDYRHPGRLGHGGHPNDAAGHGARHERLTAEKTLGVLMTILGVGLALGEKAVQRGGAT
jgi:hypothetical protein